MAPRKIASGDTSASASHAATPSPSRKKPRTNAGTKGKKAAKNRQKESHFPFLKLAPEIRNMIYVYALVSNKKIDIYRARHPRLGREMLAKRRPRTGRGRKDITPQLLRACKQIRNEATTILYSHNWFSFEKARSLFDFLGQYATHVRDLRQISLSIPNCRSDTVEAAFSMLAHAENLEILDMVYDMSGGTNGSGAARLFYGAARKWLEAVGIRAGNKYAALQVLQLPAIKTLKPVTHVDYWGHSHTTGVSESQEGQTEFLETLKSLLD